MCHQWSSSQVMKLTQKEPLPYTERMRIGTNIMRHQTLLLDYLQSRDSPRVRAGRYLRDCVSMAIKDQIAHPSTR